ncbi:acetylornithine deacetylase [Escherichia coli]|uniref:Acetylornithine deacetylase n=1 Tax=Escherichia coli TaxID=562 RepID=A0A2X3KPH8_ECOLX|nr:acetylornithine deacetylase [Escherichia coli]
MADLITLLADWFKDLGFNVEVQPVPGTRNKFNMLASIGQGAGGLLLAGIPIRYHLMTVAGRVIRLHLTEHDGKALRLRHRRHERLFCVYP